MKDAKECRSNGIGVVILCWTPRRMSAKRTLTDHESREGSSSRPSCTSWFQIARATSFIAPFAASIVFFTSRSVCAAEKNHASNCDGGG